MALRAVLVLTLLLAGCASRGSPPRAPATVSGRVLSAPTCPVERVGSPCPPRPVAGAAVVALRAGGVAASTRTDPLGRFVLRLAPGRYVIRATNTGGLATTAQRAVLLRAGAPLRVVLTVDSGIR